MSITQGGLVDEWQSFSFPTEDPRLARLHRADARPSPVALNDREVETLTWAARGKTSAEIAVILGLSKRTIDFHLDNARNKLGVATRIEAAVKAAIGQLIAP
jgi:DNA-binding CsgD family transcriptional regulator